MPRIVTTLAVALAAVGGCVIAPRSTTHEVAHLIIAALLLTLALMVVSLIAHAYRHHRLATGMARLARDGPLAGEPVGLVPGLSAPFVAGLWRPRIFCGDDLVERLEDDELRAVVLHERHHRLDRAPLRLVVISAITPVVGRVPGGRAWLERERARTEIAADTYALAAGARRSALAGALLKLSIAPGLALAPGFATAAEIRVRALLGESIGFDPDRRTAPVVAAFAALLGVCIVAFITYLTVAV